MTVSLSKAMPDTAKISDSAVLTNPAPQSREYEQISSR